MDSNRQIIRPVQCVRMAKDFNIQELLECPVCCEICIPPIYVCLTGHSLCKDCKAKIGTKCPFCRQGVKSGRNFSLEQIYNATEFVCNFHEVGCQESPRGDVFQNHVTTCRYKPFQCYLARTRNEKCKTMGSCIRFDQIVLHFTEEHYVGKYLAGQHCLHNQPLLIDEHVPLACWNLGEAWFLEQIVIKDNVIYLNILLLGEKAIAQNYKAEVHIIKNGIDCSPNILKAIHSMPVHSIRESFNEIKRNAIVFSRLNFKIDFARLEPSTQTFQWMTRVDIKEINVPSISNTNPTTLLSDILQGKTMTQLNY